MGEMAEMCLESQNDIDFYEETMMNGYGFRQEENDKE